MSPIFTRFTSKRSPRFATASFDSQLALSILRFRLALQAASFSFSLAAYARLVTGAPATLKGDITATNQQKMRARGDSNLKPSDP